MCFPKAHTVWKYSVAYKHRWLQLGRAKKKKKNSSCINPVLNLLRFFSLLLHIQSLSIFPSFGFTFWTDSSLDVIEELGLTPFKISLSIYTCTVNYCFCSTAVYLGHQCRTPAYIDSSLSFTDLWQVLPLMASI